jgi:putative membrane protein
MVLATWNAGLEAVTMMNWDSGWGVGGWLAMSLMMFVVWGLPIALVVWAVRSSFHRDRPSETTTPRPDAEQVLAERYARGEIDESEFAHRREVLGTGRRR